MKHIIIKGCHDCDKKRVDDDYTTASTIVFYCPGILHMPRLLQWIDSKTTHPDCPLDDFNPTIKEEEYIEYGPEWEKEMMKHTKKELIDKLRKAWLDMKAFRKRLYE